MSTAPASLRMVEVSGAEALWLLEGSTLGRLVYTQRDQTVIRPGRHTWEYGRLVVRTPAPAAAVPSTATYHVDELRTATGTGWTVTVAGPVDVITDPDEAAHYQRTLAGWSHGPHDTLLRLHPKTVTGFRLARAET
ncbi:MULTISPECIES: pyridoxamine 5'-phosphate oxidase family protein [unclassified Streptomyces]|uniref:pyridoxamine 5'-phosphate oxidase family protein n=1 Tax=unclassified Streptomyces TaxID=2593676 RepID=UPI001E2D1F2B|nr:MULTISPECIES: pyridoxamine 5'-phosphate oxidase family protein [unclassified Streptomyces]MCC9707417.1 pyridoxamine 5'-phosphate oxidase family protein [Streptomyces sp. MNU76]WNZ13556.1 pyridoxamine 5'-phosphate oxidase family protein [Streptomyces sp. 11x1]